MNSEDSVILILLVACGILAMVVYVLMVAVRDLVRQMTRVNECLLLAMTGKGDAGQGRALLARMMKPDVAPPKKVPEKLKGVAEKKPQMTMKMGSV